MARRKIRSTLSGGKKFEAGAKIMTTALVKSFKIGKAVAKVSSRAMAKHTKSKAYQKPIYRIDQQGSAGCLGFLLLLISGFILYKLAS